MAANKLKYDNNSSGWQIVKKNAPVNKNSKAAMFVKPLKLSGTANVTTGNGKLVSFKHTLLCGGYVTMKLEFRATRYFANDSSNPKVGKFFWWRDIQCWATKVDPYLGYDINAWLCTVNYKGGAQGEICAPNLHLQVKWEAIPQGPLKKVIKPFKPSRVYDYAVYADKGSGKNTFSPKY